MAVRRVVGGNLAPNPGLAGEGSTSTISTWIGNSLYEWALTRAGASGTYTAEYTTWQGRKAIRLTTADGPSGGIGSITSIIEYPAASVTSAVLPDLIPIVPGRSYTFSFDVWLVSGGTNVQVQLVERSYSDTLQRIRVNTSSSSTTDQWVTLSRTFTAGPTDKYWVCMMALVQQSAALFAGTAYFANPKFTDNTATARTTATNRSTASNRVAVRDMGTALRFGAAGAEVVSSSPVFTDFATTSYTASAWVNAGLVVSNAAGDQQAILGSNGTNPYWYLALRNRNYLLRYQDAGEDRQTTFPQIPNQRVFVTAVLDKTLLNIKLYVNGVLRGTQSVTSFEDVLSQQTLKVGFIAGQTSLQGIIDEPRIWNRALTDTEIQNLYLYNQVPRDGLVAEYLFNEASGSTALDTSGNGNNGTITGATYTTDTPLKARTLA